MTSPRISRHPAQAPRIRRAEKKEAGPSVIAPRTAEAQDVPVRLAEHKIISALKAPRVKKPGTVLSVYPLITAERKAVRLGFSIQAVAAIAAIIAVAAVAQGAIRSGTPALTAQVITGERTEIGLEHTKPVTLSLALTVNGRKGVADIRHDALEIIHLSLPSTWIRREVKGVPLSAVTSEAPIFGFTRWALPPGALVSFDIVSPSTLLLHHPTNIPAQIELTRVDLKAQKVERDIVLVQDGSQVLW